MKTEKNIFLAFLLNLLFSLFELAGGLLTGSAAILSDSLHDLGDALSIGISWLLERKSLRLPDEVYTFGYVRYSVLGGLITTVILILGSAAVMVHAVSRLLHPIAVHYDGMILFALVGLAVNLIAAYLTREGDSINQKAVNLHMLEDVLGWAVVLVGAVIMRFTDLVFLDAVMSLGVAAFILCHSVKNLKEVSNLFLMKAPRGLSPEMLHHRLVALDGVLDVHHIHLWSLDGHHSCASMHIVTDGQSHRIKDRVRSALGELGVTHVTLETERPGEHCHEPVCRPPEAGHSHHHHHH